MAEQPESAPAVAAADAAPERAIPPARFDFFVTSLGLQAFMAMGEMANPATGTSQPDAAQAKYLIDLLGMLQEKTKGNLTNGEEKLLADTLYQLRLAFLRMQPLGRDQKAQGEP